MSEKDKGARLQKVYITFSDDQVAVFAGPVATEPGDERGIANVQFSLPEDLPQEYSWEDMSNGN